jgi:hypothetical protein
MAIDIIVRELQTLIDTTEHDRVTFFDTDNGSLLSNGLDVRISERFKKTIKEIKIYRIEDIS